MSSVILTRRLDKILEITLDRPDKHNAIDDTMLNNLLLAVREFSEDATLRVLLLRAKGKSFSAGGDLTSKLIPDISHGSPARFRQWLRDGETSLTPLVELLAATEKPTVVAHQGACIGGALEISLACDFRLAATPAFYALPETRFGAVPSAGGIARLNQLIGPHWARWLVIAGQRIDAEKAETIGLVHAVYSVETLHAEAEALCRSLAEAPAEALAAAKLAIELTAEHGIGAARNIERLVSSSLVFGREYADELAKVQKK